MYKVKELSSELRCSFIHVPWEQNSLADNLVNWGVGQSSMYIGSCPPLLSCRSLYVVVPLCLIFSLFSIKLLLIIEKKIVVHFDSLYDWFRVAAE